MHALCADGKRCWDTALRSQRQCVVTGAKCLILGFQSDLRGTLLELVVLLIRKTATPLIRKLDEVHLGRDTFFRLLWQCSGVLVVDVDKGLMMLLLREVGWTGKVGAEADWCNVMRVIHGLIFGLQLQLPGCPCLTTIQRRRLR